MNFRFPEFSGFGEAWCMGEGAGFFKVVARFFAVGAAVLAVVLFPMSFSTAGLAEVVSDYETISELAEEHLIQSDLLYSWLVQGFLSSDAGEEQSTNVFYDVLMTLEPARQLAASKLLIPKDWAAAQLSAILEETYIWLGGGNDYPVLMLDTGALSASMNTSRAERIARIVLSSWSTCSPEMISGRSPVEIKPDEYLENACVPEEPLAVRVVERHAADSIMAIYEELPETLFLVDEVPPEDVQEFIDARKGLLRLQSLMMSLWLAPVLLLGIVMVLQIRSWRGLGHWWGIPLAAAGFLAVPAAALLPAFGRMLLRIVMRNIQEPIPRIQMLQPFLYDVLAEARGFVFGWAIVLIVAGGFMALVFSYIPGRRNRKKVGWRAVERKQEPGKAGGESAAVQGSDEDTYTGMFG